MMTGFLFGAKLAEGRKRPIDWQRLYVSRVLRIYPLYGVALTAVLLIVAVMSGFALRTPPARSPGERSEARALPRVAARRQASRYLSGMDADAEREARRAHRRATMQVRKTTLQDRAGENGLWGVTTVADRLALVAELSEAGWALSRRVVPDYGRAEMPIRVVRRSGAPEP